MANVTNGSNSVYLKTVDLPWGYNDTSIPSGPELFVQCPASQCIGGQDFKCADGYTGRLCATCEPGRFYSRGACDTQCSSIEPAWFVSLLLIAVVIGVWLGMNKLASSQCAGLRAGALSFLAAQRLPLRGPTLAGLTHSTWE